MNGYQEQTDSQKFVQVSSAKVSIGIEKGKIKKRNDYLFFQPIKDLTGKKYGRYQIITESNRDSKDGTIFWVCLCECGNIKEVSGRNLKSGSTLSCGCYSKDNRKKFSTTHGMSDTRIYIIWCSLKRRCFYKNAAYYQNYGGRGITVCNEWRHNFMNFYNWAIFNGYEEHLTIERVNNDGNYEPSNCTWIPLSEQSKNRRNSINVTNDGETHCISEWARIIGIARNVIWRRYKKGISGEELFSKYNQQTKKKLKTKER